MNAYCFLYNVQRGSMKNVPFKLYVVSTAKPQVTALTARDKGQIKCGKESKRRKAVAALAGN